MMPVQLDLLRFFFRLGFCGTENIFGIKIESAERENMFCRERQRAEIFLGGKIAPGIESAVRHSAELTWAAPKEYCFFEKKSDDDGSEPC